MPLVLNSIFGQNLSNISLDVNDGEIVVLFGPDGGGKDELFKTISGELPLRKGKIILNGKAINSAVLFEDYVIYKRRVNKGLYFFAYRRWRKRIDDKKLDIVSKIMGMERECLIAPFTKGLSKGKRKQFDMARYLITRRDIILLNDPLIGLDLRAQKITIENLKKIVAEFNQPCLYKANSEIECEELNCRTAFIKKGKVEYFGAFRRRVKF